MSTIRVSGIGTVEERLHRLEQATNYEETVLCMRLPDAGAVSNYTAHWSIPWVDLRQLLPDDRWAIWVSGWILCANGATLTVVYVKDDTSQVPLGTVAQPVTSPVAKFKVGPYAALGALAPAVPRENIGLYGFTALPGSGTVSLLGLTSWLRMTPKNV